MGVFYKEDKMDKKQIKIEYSSSALWNDSDPLAMGYDAQASQQTFERELHQAIEKEFPGADIDIDNTIEDYHKVDGMTDSPEANKVSEIIKEVWHHSIWMVKGTK
jgi:hypothetical protein